MPLFVCNDLLTLPEIIMEVDGMARKEDPFLKTSGVHFVLNDAGLGFQRERERETEGGTEGGGLREGERERERERESARTKKSRGTNVFFAVQESIGAGVGLYLTFIAFQSSEGAGTVLEVCEPPQDMLENRLKGRLRQISSYFVRNRLSQGLYCKEIGTFSMLQIMASFGFFR